MSLKHNEDMDYFLRALAELIPNAEVSDKLQEFVPKLRKTYNNNNNNNSATAEDGIIDVSLDFLTTMLELA
jgi:hypothetical protein